MAVSAAPSAAVESQRINFNNAQGDTLVGVHTLPGARHAALLQHGYASSKDGFHLQRIAQALAEGGVGSFRFDYSGNGESSGNFRFANYAAEVDEMEAAVKLIESRGSKVIGVLGHSKAGSEVIQYGARHDSRDLSIVNVCGRFNLKEGISKHLSDEQLRSLRANGSVVAHHPKTGQPFNITEQELDERINTDMAEIASAIRVSHVLTIHGSNDETIPVADAAEFAQRIRLHTLEIVDGADHRFSQEQHAQTVVDLASRYLLTSAARAVMRGR